MRRRYRGPILWIALGVVVVLAYILSQPVPIPTTGYTPPVTAEAPTGETTAAIVPTPAEPVAPDPLAPVPAAVAVDPPIPATTVETVTPPATPAPVAAATPAVQVMYVDASSLNLRAAPEAGAAVLEVLPRGTRVEVVGSVEGWREVVNPATGMRGWMSAEYLTATAPPGEAPQAPGAVRLP